MADDEPTDFEFMNVTWEDAEELYDSADFVALPCGSIEQHSIHLPLSVDTLRGDNLVRELAKKAPEHDLEIAMLPVLPYGYSEHHMSYAGTITLMPDTYTDVIIEIGRSVKHHGGDRLMLVNFHGGNRQPLKLAADRLQRDHDMEVYNFSWTDFAREQLKDEFGDEWGHAGDHETSAIELYHPELVKQDKKEPQVRKADYETRQYKWFSDITEQGGLGDPTNSDPEFMAEVVDDTNDRILEALKADMAQ
ncbi:MAG: creatininase family protein [Halobacteriales archaeon]|nr:creatininase family protein [Halobacteriales archaeon]